MAIDKSALLAQLDKEQVDFSKAVGGGEYVPPAAGVCHLRFFGYIEVGKHEKKNAKKPNGKEVVNLVRFGFEISGPNHPAKEDGTRHTIWIEEKNSLNEKANMFKLFAKLNHAGTAKHPLALLGNAYLGTLHHRKYKRADGSDGTALELRAKGEAYDIRPTTYQDPGSGQPVNVQVAALQNAERAFLWDRPDLEQWSSIFIDGEYPARTNDAGEVTRPAKSKNEDQARIMRAQNFKGSPMEVLLLTNGKSLDIPDAEVEDTGSHDDEAAPAVTAQQAQPTPTGKAADDALSGIVG